MYNMNNLFYDLPEDIQTKMMNMKQEIEDSENINESNDNIICIECGEEFIPEEMEESDYKICRDCLRDNHSIDLDY